MDQLLQELRHSLIVSCQSEEGDPFNSPASIALFAKAAVMGGAQGIRARGVENIQAVMQNVNVPVIGITKSAFPDGSVRITGSFAEAESLVDINCPIIAVDGTFRERDNFTGPDFIKELKKRYQVIVMADIATYDEGAACAQAGADIIATTLCGYTPGTQKTASDEPNFELVHNLASSLHVPVIAEGKVNTPSYAAEMMKQGAFAVVVGTAITRPRIVTGWFNQAIKKSTDQ